MSAHLSEAAVEHGDIKMLILNAVAAASAESTPLVVGCIFRRQFMLKNTPAIAIVNPTNRK